MAKPKRKKRPRRKPARKRRLRPRRPKKRRTVARRRRPKPRRPRSRRTRRPKKKRATARRRPARRSRRKSPRLRPKRRRVTRLRRANVRGWAKWPRERLLNARIGDLPLRIQGAPLRPAIAQLQRELRNRGLALRPHFWLSNEWFTPDDVPGIAIPFFLAHPRLRELEREFMLEVEGGTRDECLRLLRHETAHALLNAYRLDRRKDWREHFGRPNQKYPDTYLPQPYSKRFVVHLDNWYAQAHPHEDWAETFAVWLNPRSDWRNRYRDWPALKKLEYVDRLMQEIQGQKPRRQNRRQVDPQHSLRMTLREYYENKRKLYGKDSPEFFDRDLRRLFSDAPEHRKNELAARYIRRVQDRLIEIVGRWTSEHHYRIREVLQEMIERCEENSLRVTLKDQPLREEMIAALTAFVVNKLRSGGFRIRL